MSADITLALLLTATGLFTSALSGVAGLGGGTILIAVIYALGMAPVEAIPLFAAVQFVSNTTRTLAYLKDVEWHATGWFLLAAVPATLLIAPYAAVVNVSIVRLVLAGLILASLLPSADARPLPPRFAFATAGFLNGTLGLFVGATGLFVGRLFLRPEWPRKRVVATLALTQMFGHGMRVLAYGFEGYSAFAKPVLLLPVCASVIVGTLLGKSLNDKLSETTFRMVFKAILITLSAKLAWDGVTSLLAGH